MVLASSRRELQARGHDTVAPDLPCDDDTAGLNEYVDTVVEAIGDRTDVLVVGHSLGGFTAPLVADRVSANALVLVAGMIPAPGEPPGDWWENTGYRSASDAHAQQEGYADQKDDPFVTFYNGVPRVLAEEAMSKERGQSSSLDGRAVAARRVARRADEVRGVPRRPFLSSGFTPPAGEGALGHHPRRDRWRRTAAALSHPEAARRRARKYSKTM